MRLNARPQVIGISLAGLALAVDQVTKQMALHYLAGSGPVPVLPFLNLRLGFNEGVSFGMFADWFQGRPLVLAAVMLLVILLLAFWLHRASSAVEVLSISAILGGAIGNTVDRVRLGAVVDFLDFHGAGYHWPTFNVADIAIVGGAIGIAVSSLFEQRRAPAISPEQEAQRANLHQPIEHLQTHGLRTIEWQRSAG